ncbi:major facilitator superfamily domain-containing protein [Trichoderma chlorosporum]
MAPSGSNPSADEIENNIDTILSNDPKKVTMSFASIIGIKLIHTLMGKTLGHGNHYPLYNWLTTCIFITVLTVEYPQNYIIARVPIAKYHGLNITAWDSLWFEFFLASLSWFCQPTFVILSSIWYRREKQAARVTYMMTGAQRIVGDLLAYCLWLFPIYGAIGGFVAWYMSDSPMRASQFIEALMDPQIWGYCLIQLCKTLPTSGLAMVIGFVKRIHQNLYVMTAIIIPSFIGTICLFTAPLDATSQKKFLLSAPISPCRFGGSNTSNQKSVAVALNFIAWAAGNAIGPQVFLLLLIVLPALRFYLSAQNKKQDNLAAAGLYEARDDLMIHAWEI